MTPKKININKVMKGSNVAITAVKTGHVVSIRFDIPESSITSTNDWTTNVIADGFPAISGLYGGYYIYKDVIPGTGSGNKMGRIRLTSNGILQLNIFNGTPAVVVGVLTYITDT